MSLAALPADGIAIFLIPSSTHIDIAQDRPRALNEPVGLMPSSFTHKCFIPRRAAVRRVEMSGVKPSPSDTRHSGRDTGSTGAYRHIEAGARMSHSRLQFWRAFSRS